MNHSLRDLRSSQLPHYRRAFALAGTRTGVLGLTTVGNLIVRTGSSMILTRLLAPAEFGIVGLITSVFFAVALVTDLGFQDFLIRHERTDDQHFRNVIWTIHAARGIGICALVAITSPLIAGAFGKPIIAAPLAVASFIFAFNGVSSLSLMTALRHDKARELSLLEFVLQLLQTALCIGLAFWLRNAWSIIIAMIAQSAVRSVLSYRLFAGSSQGFARDPAISREFIVFSRFVMVSSLLALAIGQSDKLVLGRIFTLHEFGLYSIALTIASAPVSFADSYVNRIVFPVCARTWREARDELSIVYYKVKRSPSALYAFACGGLIGSANLVVAVLYDGRYSPAANFVSLLMIGTALRLPNVAAGQLMVATGQVQKSMHLTFVRFLWVVISIPAALALYGPMGVVAAIGAMEVPATFYCWYWLRTMRVLQLKEEIVFPTLVVAGAAIGWTGSSILLNLFPRI